MLCQRESGSFQSLLGLFLAIFFTAFILAFSVGGADELAPSNAERSMSAESILGILDGQEYRVTIVRSGTDENKATKPLGDRLIFSNGKFSSEICKKFNFSEAPYWIRTDKEATHFLVELTSPTDGKMVWEGTVHNKRIDGTMRWTKKRWYWTIDVEHKIYGELESRSKEAHSSLN